jgi:hypothetical protein
VGRFHIRQLLSDRSLTAEECRAVLEDLFAFGKNNQAPFLFRMTVLLVLSTIIANAGLISDSAAVVIGAMLVAPLMNPVMAAAGAFLWCSLDGVYNGIRCCAVVFSDNIRIFGAGFHSRAGLGTYPSDLLRSHHCSGCRFGRRIYNHSQRNQRDTRCCGSCGLLPPLASSGILLTTG